MKPNNHSRYNFTRCFIRRAISVNLLHKWLTQRILLRSKWVTCSPTLAPDCPRRIYMPTYVSCALTVRPGYRPNVIKQRMMQNKHTALCFHSHAGGHNVMGSRTWQEGISVLRPDCEQLYGNVHPVVSDLVDGASKGINDTSSHIYRRYRFSSLTERTSSVLQGCTSSVSNGPAFWPTHVA
jgi:hypothetical protein